MGKHEYLWGKIHWSLQEVCGSVAGHWFLSSESCWGPVKSRSLKIKVCLCYMADTGSHCFSFFVPHHFCISLFCSALGRVELKQPLCTMLWKAGEASPSPHSSFPSEGNSFQLERSSWYRAVSLEDGMMQAKWNCFFPLLWMVILPFFFYPTVLPKFLKWTPKLSQCHLLFVDGYLIVDLCWWTEARISYFILVMSLL